MEFLLVTGLSGAGKSRTMHILEDIGFYCVDNIPPEFIPTFYNLCQKDTKKLGNKIAVETDIRADNLLENLPGCIKKLREEGKQFKLLYLEAREDVLTQRFKENRRKHPLIDNCKGVLHKALQFEQNLVSRVKPLADYTIDTSYLSIAQLKERVSNLFLEDPQDSLSITCISFGFKYGLPTESDLVFDVRCFKNPYYQKDLKDLTGLDEPVKEYVLQDSLAKEYIKRLINLLDYTLPLYKKEGKSQLVISIGCTGGRHRSVAISNFLYDYFKENEQNVSIVHRDYQK